MWMVTNLRKCCSGSASHMLSPRKEQGPQVDWQGVQQRLFTTALPAAFKD